MKTKWNPWPVGIVAFFLVAVAGCVSFVVFCSLHPTDLVAADYYEQEIRYQGQMERIERTREFGAMASIRHDPGARRIIITVPPPHSGGAAMGQVHFYRPSDAALDHTIPLEVDERGTQHLSTKDLRPGFWKIKVLWKAGGQEFFLNQALEIGL